MGINLQGAILEDTIMPDGATSKTGTKVVGVTGTKVVGIKNVTKEPRRRMERTAVHSSSFQS
jgi:hypothetical protein